MTDSKGGVDVCKVYDWKVKFSEAKYFSQSVYELCSRFKEC